MKYGIVLEGGGLRGMFTAGVLDVFMENKISIDGAVGVSAGALFGINYKSEQPGRAFRYNIQYKDDKRYMSMISWLTTGNYVNEKFSYDTLPNELDRLDFERFRDNPMEFYAVCSDIKKGIPIYKKIVDAKTDIKWLQASASMPIFSEPVEIDGSFYLDGGMTDSIPLVFMQKQKYEKNIVVLTRPVGYRKKNANLGLLLKMWHRSFPMVAKLMNNRPFMYNCELEYVLDQQKKGTTLVIAPEGDLKIGRIELDEKKMKSIYEAGRAAAFKCLSNVKTFLSD